LQTFLGLDDSNATKVDVLRAAPRRFDAPGPWRERTKAADGIIAIAENHFGRGPKKWEWFGVAQGVCERSPRAMIVHAPLDELQQFHNALEARIRTGYALHL
jgi:hypothetical protein